MQEEFEPFSESSIIDAFDVVYCLGSKLDGAPTGSVPHNRRYFAITCAYRKPVHIRRTIEKEQIRTCGVFLAWPACDETDMGFQTVFKMGKGNSRCTVCETVTDDDKNERLERTHGGAHIEGEDQLLCAVIPAECHHGEGTVKDAGFSHPAPTPLALNLHSQPRVLAGGFGNDYHNRFGRHVVFREV